MASNPYSNVSVSGYNSDAPTDDGAQTSNNRVTWAKHKTKIGDPLKTAIEAMDSAVDDAFNTIANILVDFTGDFGSGGITGLVPAPAAGDAANNRFLRADGTWTTPAGAGSVTSVATGSGLTGGPITGSGTISLASIDNNTVLGNLSGVTAAPGAVLLPALLNALDVFQGDLGSGGVKGLVPAPAAGESNLFLRGDGTWAATVDNYSGTVTSIATGSGLTGGTITTSGTISLASISDQTLLANLSGSSAAPSEHNISELTPYLSNFGGDFGSGGAKGLVPAPAAGDSAKYLRGDGTWVTVSGTGTVTSVNITAPAAGITATGGPVTVSGSITLALADDLAALEAMSSAGIVTRTASNTYAQRTITGTSNQITVTNGDGVSGNPTISLPSSITISGSITVGNTGIVVGASTPFSDSTGTLTLQNVDALDATTEATIEAAIDTLANLTSIQGRTVTLADAGANAIFGWDDTASAYENLTAAEATAVLNAFVGDSGAGGTKGLVPAPVAGDSTKFLRGDGTFQTIPGGGDALTSGDLSQFAATTSLQLKNVISDETGSGALVFANTPTLVTPVLGTPTSGTLTNCTGLPVSGIASIANNSFVGNVSGSSASPSAVTAGQLLSTLDTFIGDAGSGGGKGLVPAPSAGDDYKYLKGDGTWASGYRIGEIVTWPLATAPAGTLICDGSAISRTTYAALFAVIGTTYGVGDNSTTFNIPDYRGQFLRGWANGSSNDPDRASRTDRGDGTTGDNIGTKQSYAMEAHTHTRATGTNFRVLGSAGSNSLDTVAGSNNNLETATGAVNSATTSSNETRPRNVAVNYCIAYQ